MVENGLSIYKSLMRKYLVELHFETTLIDSISLQGKTELIIPNRKKKQKKGLREQKNSTIYLKRKMVKCEEPLMISRELCFLAWEWIQEVEIVLRKNQPSLNHRHHHHLYHYLLHHRLHHHLHHHHFINKNFTAENIKINEFYNNLNKKFNTEEEI